jgi:DNA excision repair protein ERCC-4
LKLNFDEPDELSAMMKGQTDVPTLRDSIENPGAVEMLRAIPGISGHNLRLVMSKVEGIQGLIGLKQKELREMIGEKNGTKVWKFLHLDSRVEAGYEPDPDAPAKGRR